MKLFRPVLLGFGLAALTCLMVLPFAGCEHGETGGTFANNGTLSLRPSSYTFGSATRTTFDLEVRGGTPPFKWTVSDSASGTLTGVPAGGTNMTPVTKATYKRKTGAYGYNTITVHDSRNWRATCTVKVKDGIDL